ncbi:MAG: holo-ACP synthase [Planctomycetota bacterium]
MNVVGVGVDLVELERIRDAIDRYGDRFLHRIYSEEEREVARAKTDAVPYLAGRFAAKEAISKSLGTGVSGAMSWTELQVLSEPSGQPTVTLLGESAEVARRAGVGKVLLSISHGRDLAIAHAIAIRADG